MTPMTPKQHPPSPVRQVTSPEPPSRFCCCSRRPSKVNPVSGIYPGYDIVEVRPGRHLRIMHLNPRKRNDKFQTEMERYMTAQIKSGKYGTRGKSWNLPQPGKMDKTQSFQQYQKTNSVKSQDGLYGNTCSYQSYNGDVGLNQLYRGEDNLSFRAESPEVERKHGADQNGSISTAAIQEISLPPDQLGLSNTSSLSMNSGKKNAPRASTATSVTLQIQGNENQEQGQSAHSSTEPISTPPIPDPNKEQTVIFFIHGVGGSSAVWQAQADHFVREGYELVLPDLIGHGFSSAPQEPDAYNFCEIACDLLVIFDLYCKRKNMVVGHSYGSSFAAVLGRQRLQFISQLVMVSGGSPTPLAPQPGTFSFPTWLLACCKPVLNRGFRRSAFHDKKAHTLMDRAFDVPTYVLKYTMNGQNWLEGGEDYHRWLSPPTLLIYGRQDKLVTLEEEQEMERIVIGSILEVIEGASHMVMMEQSDMVNNLLHRFLLGKIKPVASPTSSEADFKTINNSRASLRSNKSVPSGLVAGNLK